VSPLSLFSVPSAFGHVCNVVALLVLNFVSQLWMSEHSQNYRKLFCWHGSNDLTMHRNHYEPHTWVPLTMH
jgi:hypothetical protein